MKITSDTKMEELKKRVNASHIIKEEALNSSRTSQLPMKKSAPVMIKSKYSINESGRISSQKRILEQKLSDQVSAEQEKRELELLIEEQREKQEDLKSIRGKANQQLQSENEKLAKEIEELTKSISSNKETLDRMSFQYDEDEAEKTNLLDMNRGFEIDLQRLGDKTENKIREMADKLKEEVNDCDMLKKEHAKELSRLREMSTSRLKQLEEDSKSKISELNRRAEEAIEEKQNIQDEISRLEDVHRRADSDLEDRIRQMKAVFYDESFDQAQAMLRISNNRLKETQNEKETLSRKLEVIFKEMSILESRSAQEAQNYVDENASLSENIEHFKVEFSTAQKDLEALKRQVAALDSEEVRVNHDISRENNQIKNTASFGKQRLGEHVSRYQRVTEEYKMRITSSRDRIKDLEEELAMIQEKGILLQENNQKQIETIRSQLNKALLGTFGEGPSQQNDSFIPERSVKNNNYSHQYN